MAHAGVNVNGTRTSNALNLLAEQRVEVDLESPRARRLLRKIDMRTMPLVLGLYTLQFLVRTGPSPCHDLSNWISAGQK